MSPNLPRPGSVRRKKRRQLAVRLHARLILPKLVDRLSRGFITVDETTADRWSGWIESLQSDPAWEVIEPVVDMPEAWPEAWQRARNKGFSEATEHHQAIFFTRLFERTIEESRFDLGRITWKRALNCWASLADGEYFTKNVLEPAAVQLNDEQRRQVLTTLLDGPMAGLRSTGKNALRLKSWDAPPSRRPLQFVLDAVNTTHDILADPPGPVADGAIERAETIQKVLTRCVVDAMDRRLESLDYSSVQLQPILDVFDGALTRCRHLQFPTPLDRVLLRRGLDVIWNLRDAGRDDELGIIPPMVDRLEPCTERLADSADDDAFGLEGAIADLRVFQGEEELSLDDRKAAFEAALQICPGHRNASRLLSYVLLEQANRDLLKTAALPDATARVNLIRDRIRPLIERAAEKIERAETLYPENDLLAGYRADLEGEIERFHLVLEPDHED